MSRQARLLAIFCFKKLTHIICTCLLLSFNLNGKPFGDLHSVDSAIGLRMIWVNIDNLEQPASFQKGSPPEEKGHLSDENLHVVTLTNGYYLGKYEVTQAEFEAVMRNNTQGLETRPSNFSKNENQPVESISFDDVTAFLKILNEKEREAGRLSDKWQYSLPTEAEWEFACRAGSTSPFSTGNQITGKDANFLPSDLKKPVVVGAFTPNPWGFYDMHGNVKEWCSDWYQSSYAGAYSDPSGPIYSRDLRGNYRQPSDYFVFTSDRPDPLNYPSKVIKGGAFDSDANGVRSARRYHASPDQKYINLGFRLALKRRESDFSLMNSLVGKEITVVSGNRIRAEVFWENSGASVSFVPSSDEISNFFEIIATPAFVQGDGSLIRPNKDNPSQYDSVPEMGYNVKAYEGNVTGNLIYEQDFSIEDFKTFMNSENLAFSKYYYDQEEVSAVVYESLSHSLVSFFEDSFDGPSASFLDEANLLINSPGWRWIAWLGYFYADSFPWIYHENLGWVFVSQKHSDRAWLYRENLGWAWTASSDWWSKQSSTSEALNQNNFAFPYLYRYGADENDTKVWTYLSLGNSLTTLYDFEEKEWFLLDEPYYINTSVFPRDGGIIEGNGTYYRWQQVIISAIPSNDFRFWQWSEDFKSNNPIINFVAKKSEMLGAVFLPEPNTNFSTTEKARIFQEILASRDDLSSLQKEWALAELIFLGNSPTAGIP